MSQLTRYLNDRKEMSIEKEFNEYMETGFRYQGVMNGMANSIDLLLNCILEKLGVKSPDMLGGKISVFKKSKGMIGDRYTGNFDKLVIKLEEFNKIWIITKHGMLVGGLKYLTFSKDMKLHTFDQNRQAEVSREFTEIMTNLLKIHEAL